VVQSGSDVEAFNSVRCPGWSGIGLIMAEDFSFGRRYWRAGEVAFFTEMFPSKHVRSYARFSKEIECEFRLGQQSVAFRDREVWIRCAEHGNDVVLGCLNRMFSRICAVLVERVVLPTD